MSEQKVKRGWPIIVEDKEQYPSYIDKEVHTKEYGKGIIRAIEVFPCGSSGPRFIVEITETSEDYKQVLKSLFPDNRLAFWPREVDIDLNKIW